MIPLPNISVVVIGYNEAANLDATFHAIKAMDYPLEKIELIYVDSGSRDGSVEIARKYADKIFIEDRFPSPGRNRNRGLMEASHDIVHFIDGDVIIDNAYLRNIIPLFNKQKAHAITGKLEELNPNIYNLMAMYANTTKKEGYTLFTNTGASYLRKALLAVNGYDERIKRGQETELGHRFRSAGYKIWRTKHRMGTHNFGITNLLDFLQIFYVNGISMCQASLLPDKGNFFQQTRTTIINQHLKFAFYIFLIFYTLFWHNYYPLLFSFVFLLIVQNRSIIRNIRSKNRHYSILKIFISFVGQFFFYFGIIKVYFNYLNKSNKEFYDLKKMNLS